MITRKISPEFSALRKPCFIWWLLLRIAAIHRHSSKVDHSADFGTELPFLITENFADVKFLVGGNRPNSDLQYVAKRRPGGRRLYWYYFKRYAATLHLAIPINPSKNGTASTHPLGGPDIRALRRLQRDYPETPYVFVTERKGPLTDSNVRKMVARVGRNANIGFPVHPHMLRHACGYKLANDGNDTRVIQHYMGHRNIQHTVRYTEFAADRFNGFWAD